MCETYARGSVLSLCPTDIHLIQAVNRHWGFLLPSLSLPSQQEAISQTSHLLLGTEAISLGSSVFSLGSEKTTLN